MWGFNHFGLSWSFILNLCRNLLPQFVEIGFQHFVLFFVVNDLPDEQVPIVFLTQEFNLQVLVFLH